MCCASTSVFAPQSVKFRAMYDSKTPQRKHVEEAEVNQYKQPAPLAAQNPNLSRQDVADSLVM
jgi:hypothetical protein